MCTGTHDFIPAPNVAQVELLMRLDGQKIENRVFILGTDQWESTSLQELAESAASAWAAELSSLLSDQLSLVMVRAGDMETEFGDVVEFEPDPVPVGAVTGGSMPNNVTLTTKFSSGRKGRSYRGRVYTPGIPRASVGTSAVNEVSAVLAGDFSSSWGNFFNTLISLTDNALRHVIVSYCFNNTWRTTAEVTNVTGYSTNVTLDSQRRRLPERGE